MRVRCCPISSPPGIRLVFCNFNVNLMRDGVKRKFSDQEWCSVSAALRRRRRRPRSALGTRAGVDHNQPFCLLTVCDPLRPSFPPREARRRRRTAVEGRPGFLCGLRVLCEATAGRRLCDCVVVSLYRRAVVPARRAAVKRSGRAAVDEGGRLSSKHHSLFTCPHTSSICSSVASCTERPCSWNTPVR